jgi:hypothetical protein
MKVALENTIPHSVSRGSKNRVLDGVLLRRDSVLELKLAPEVIGRSANGINVCLEPDLTRSFAPSQGVKTFLDC